MKKPYDLLKTAESSENLWEEQAAAMEFTKKYGYALWIIALLAKHVKLCDLDGRHEEMKWVLKDLYQGLKNLEDIDA